MLGMKRIPWSCLDYGISMLFEINDAYMFLTTAKEIWEVVRKTYPKVHDTAQIYEIKTKISATKQCSHLVTKFAHLLRICDKRWIIINVFK